MMPTLPISKDIFCESFLMNECSKQVYFLSVECNKISSSMNTIGGHVSLSHVMEGFLKRSFYESDRSDT